MEPLDQVQSSQKREFRAIKMVNRASKKLSKLERYLAKLTSCCFLQSEIQSHYEWLKSQKQSTITERLYQSLDFAERKDNKFLFKGKYVCESCFAGLFLMSKRTLYRRLKDYQDGFRSYVHGNEGKKSPRKLATIQSISTLVSNQGQFNPASDRIEIRGGRETFREQVEL